MPVRFLTPNPADSATLTASTEKTGYPVENVQDARLTKRWITKSAAIQTLDDCETADWTESTDASNDTLDAVTFKEGSNSINMGKSGTASTSFSYQKTLGSSYDATDHLFSVWIYITDVNELASALAMEVIIGNDISNNYRKSYARADLSNGWNDITLLVPDGFSVAGSPDITDIDYLRIIFYTPLAADTVAHGNVKMDYWRIYNELDEFIEFDFGAAQAVTAAVIDGHDFDGTETNILLDSSTDAVSWTNRATFTYASGEALAVFIDSVSARYWRIIFTKANPTDEREIGRIFIGTYVQPARGMQLGWKRTLSDSSQSKRAFSGTQFADIRNKWWEVDFKLAYEASASFATLRSAVSTLGIGTPLWIALDPVNNPNGPYTLYGRFSKPWSESEPINDYFDVSFKFAEDI